MFSHGERLSERASAAFPTLTSAETSLLWAAAVGKYAYCGCQPDEEHPEEANNPLNSASWGEERTMGFFAQPPEKVYFRKRL